MANLGILVCVCVMPQVRAFLTRDRPCPHIVSDCHVDVNVCVVFSHTFDVIACPTPVHGKLPIKFHIVGTKLTGTCCSIVVVTRPVCVCTQVVQGGAGCEVHHRSGTVVV